ncbi:hypothetical protein, partial [Rhizobium sp. 1399]|uniref:hypothetical protein n=1 Tax=Rhizobium sp. 1399 TaxID=2817758 RepID=UPI00286A704B
VSLERKTSSPAAPPPSFSEWAYNPHTSKQSTGLFQKNRFSSILLFLQEILYRLLKAARFPDSDLT